MTINRDDEDPWKRGKETARKFGFDYIPRGAVPEGIRKSIEAAYERMPFKFREAGGAGEGIFDAANNCYFFYDWGGTADSDVDFDNDDRRTNLQIGFDFEPGYATLYEPGKNQMTLIYSYWQDICEFKEKISNACRFVIYLEQYQIAPLKRLQATPQAFSAEDLARIAHYFVAYDTFKNSIAPLEGWRFRHAVRFKFDEDLSYWL